METLTALAASSFGAEPAVIRGRGQPFARTPWQEDLEASRDALGHAASQLGQALREAAGTPLVLATDCALGMATLPVVARVEPGARVLWLDAHCDFDTPETTTIGFLGCMSLAGACGFWKTGFEPSFDPARVVLCGTRPAPDDFDIVAQRQVEASEVMLVPISETTMQDALTALSGSPVYVHLDPDVLDPSVNPVPYARPNGMSANALCDLLAAVAAQGRVVGAEITAFHSPDDADDRRRLAALLVRAVTPLLASRPTTGRPTSVSTPG